MKRILVFSLAYYPMVGGAEVAIKEITDRIKPGDIEFHMVTLCMRRGLPRIEQVGNVLVHRVGSGSGLLAKFFFQFSAAFAALTLYRRNRYDAVWAVMAHSSGVPAAIFKLFRPQVPYILTLQEGDPPKHIERVMLPVWPLFSRAFTSADVVQAISNFLGQWARRRGFAGPLEVIPNAVDTALFSHTLDSDTRRALEDELGKKEGEVLLITTSRLVRKNAVDDVIRALQTLPAHIRFVVLGSGTEEQSLMSLAQTLGVEHRISWLGYVSHKDLPKYLHVCDIFIRPSRSEGMGNSFIEAFAAGIPVIATQEGGIADFLFDAKRNPGKPSTGWAVDPDSPKQIAEAVQDIIVNPEKVKEVVQNARELAAKGYDWNIIAPRMREQVFGRVLKNS